PGGTAQQAVKCPLQGSLNLAWLDARGSLTFVNLPRIENALADDLELVTFHLAEEAACVTLMARRTTNLMDLEEDRVGVAVDVDFAYFLDVPPLFAFAPELAAAAAVIHGAAGSQRFLVGFLIHPGEHQHLSCGGVLGNGGDETAGFGKVHHV